MRLRHKPWAKPLIEEHKDVALNDNDLLTLSPFDILEVGSGCGGFLIKMAQKRKDKQFLGAEVAYTAFAIAIKKLEGVEESQRPNNLRFINTSIDRLADQIKPESLEEIYLNFSDPWPKKRHHKRRLTFPTRLQMYYSWLKKGGKLAFKTDNDALYHDSKEYFASFSKFRVEFIDDYDGKDETDEMSEYEEKFRLKGQKIHRIIAYKTGEEEK
jgi:tRNA (guanine-N7-)-methyltransferase